MNKELVINSTSSGVEIALIENKQLVEMHYDHHNAQFTVGDLYVGKVKKLMKGLNAVFVDIGHTKDAFLHYTDLSPNFRSLNSFTQAAMSDSTPEGFDFGSFAKQAEILKTGNVTELFTANKGNVLVQILKEPISSKGPRISCEISLPGRFLVLSPFGDFVSVSRKIDNADERKRLQHIIESIKPKNFGVIVRTAAEGQSTAELHQDLLELAKSWQTIQLNLRHAQAPCRVMSEQNKTTSILRDLLSGDFNAVVANDADVAADAAAYIAKVAPEKQNIVSHYKQRLPIFDHYGINKQVKGSFGKTVMMESGGYLIFEHTEACHVVDVNSGHKFSNDNQEQTSLTTNLVAAKELARQLRLRDLGGIIIVDFIDMKNPDHKKALQLAVENAMKDDRARHTILPISKFGLMQITRQRLRPEINIQTGETCPTCQGTGTVRSSELIVDDIESKIATISKTTKGKLNLHVHTIMHSHLTKGMFSNINKQWNKKYGVRIKIVAEPSYEIIKYAFFDGESGEEIKL
jgi:ribonuclease G